MAEISTKMRDENKVAMDHLRDGRKLTYWGEVGEILAGRDASEQKEFLFGFLDDLIGEGILEIGEAQFAFSEDRAYLADKLRDLAWAIENGGNE